MEPSQTELCARGFVLIPETFPLQQPLMAVMCRIRNWLHSNNRQLFGVRTPLCQFALKEGRGKKKKKKKEKKKKERKKKNPKDPGPGNHWSLIPPLAADKTGAFQCSIISCTDLERDFSIHWAVNLLFYIYYMMYKRWISSRENMPRWARSLGRNFISG